MFEKKYAKLPSRLEKIAKCHTVLATDGLNGPNTLKGLNGPERPKRPNRFVRTQLQRYEGASTLFGPFTLPIYEKQYTKLANALVNGAKLERGPAPVDLRPDVVSLLPTVLYDTPVSRHSFGDCILQPPYSATWGQTVNAKFVSGKHVLKSLFFWHVYRVYCA